MATVTPFIRTSTKKAEKVNIRFRLMINNRKSFYHSSEIEVTPSNWDNVRFEIKTKVVYNEKNRKEFNNSVFERKNLILEIYNRCTDKASFSSEMLDFEIKKILHPEQYTPEITDKTIFDLFDDFLAKHPLSEVRKNNYRVIKRALQRFELFQQKRNKSYQLTLDNITSDTLHKLDVFLKNEHQTYLKYPEIYKEIPESRTPQPRGQNTMSGIYSKIKTFFKWCTLTEHTVNNPFLKFETPSEVYGTPYYISIDERNKLYDFDLINRPQLAVQRDIFVFQCLVGCRVGDLYKMKKSNVNNNVLSYIARKTKDKHPVTVKVPLNDKAIDILARYKSLDTDDKILPFISEQKYNEAIKEAFKLADINRVVTILNPTTGEQEQHPLNEIASSHLARRTFIGNLYKKVKDPNLIGSMSGHKEGSKAFARYREIDEQDKIDVIKMLD